MILAAMTEKEFRLEMAVLVAERERLISDDTYALEWLERFRWLNVTPRGRRWLNRVFSHLEERVYNELRGRK